MGHGFWSYVHKDDAAMHGAIRRLAEHVKDEYELLSGGSALELFFDGASLKWGDNWRDRIQKALEDTTFLIPIITPRFFKSEECRRELMVFSEKADQLGLQSLIMPLYFADVRALEDRETGDAAVQLIASRQHEDWRTLRFLDETVQPYRIAVNRLATRLLELTGGSLDSGPESAENGKSGPGTVGRIGNTPTGTDTATGIPAEQSAGIFDLLAAGEEAFPRLVDTITSIGGEIEAVGTITASATDEIKASDAAGKGFRGRLLVMNRLAQTLGAPANELEGLTSKYAADLLVLDPAMKELIRLLGNESEDDPRAVQEFFGTVRGMVANSANAAESIKGMIAGMEDNERFSRELGVPLKRMRVSLQSMVDGQQLIESWQESIDGLDDNA